MFMKNFKLKFEQNWPKPFLITNPDREQNPLDLHASSFSWKV